jgi:hypothetical protein
VRHVVWIGGGTGSGKSTLARALSVRYALRRYSIDDRWYAHDDALREPRRTPDEQWVDTPPDEQARDWLATSPRRMALVLDELRTLPDDPPIVVEGPQVLPSLLPVGSRAVFLETSAEAQERVLRARPMPPTRDPPRALRNRIEKDRLVAEHVTIEARRLGYPVVDRGAAEATLRLELRETAADFAAVRRWENEAFAANVRAWLASGDAGGVELPLWPFVCECGDPHCAEVVSRPL